MMLYGYKIIVDKGYQKQRLSSNVTVTDKFRKEMDAWLAGFFGFHDILSDGQVIKSEPNRTLVMNENTFNKLDKAIEAQNRTDIRYHNFNRFHI